MASTGATLRHSRQEKASRAWAEQHGREHHQAGRLRNGLTSQQGGYNDQQCSQPRDCICEDKLSRERMAPHKRLNRAKGSCQFGHLSILRVSVSLCRKALWIRSSPNRIRFDVRQWPKKTNGHAVKYRGPSCTLPIILSVCERSGVPTTAR
jgi:hypothetical protein